MFVLYNDLMSQPTTLRHTVLYFQLFHLSTAVATRDQVMGLTLDYTQRRDLLLSASANHDIPSFTTSITLITCVLIADILILTAYTTWMYNSGITSTPWRPPPSTEKHDVSPAEKNGAVCSSDSEHNNNGNSKKAKGNSRERSEGSGARRNDVDVGVVGNSCVAQNTGGSRKRNVLKKAKSL